jgi:putative transposase
LSAGRGRINHVSIRQRAYPRDGDQRAVLDMHCRHARYVFNLGLEHRQLRYQGRRASTSAALQMRELTEARREFAWLADGSTVVQQGALRDLDRAYQNFFDGHAKFPRYRKRSDSRHSFVIRDVTLTRINRKWATLTVPKAGQLRFRVTRGWAQVKAATSARVSLERGQWHVSLTTAPPDKLNTHTTAAPIGIDRGVAHTLATNDSEFFQAPSWSPGEQRRFLALQRQLSSCSKGSRRREVTKVKMAVLRRRLVDRRTDWIEQTTTELALRHRVVAIEKLATVNMVRRPKPKPDPDRTGAYLPNRAAAKAKLNAAIYASCWGRFADRLNDKTDVVEVAARNASIGCNRCGHIDARNRKSQAVFRCISCGHHGHADTHAAMNIHDRAFGPPVTACRGTRGQRAEAQADANPQTAT